MKPHHKRSGQKTKRKPPGIDWRVSATDASMVPKGWRMSADELKTGRLIFESCGHVFDELKVDDWIHIERMNDHQWWMRLGEAQFDIIIEQNGSTRICFRSGKMHPMGDGEVLLKGE